MERVRYALETQHSAEKVSKMISFYYFFNWQQMMKILMLTLSAIVFMLTLTSFTIVLMLTLTLFRMLFG